MTKHEQKPLTITFAIKKLRKGNHILSKNYGDGAGRQFWLRTKNQNDIGELTAKQVESILKRMKLYRESVISSDSCFLLYIKGKGEFL